jgi:hypothetical protein
MPRGLKVITGVNASLLAFFAIYLVFVFYAGQTVRTLNFVCSWIAIAGILAAMVGTMMRSPVWHKLTRTAVYIMILAFGVQLMGLVPELLSLSVFATALGLGVLIFYLVGVRGYLNSEPARRWFRVIA